MYISKTSRHPVSVVVFTGLAHYQLCSLYSDYLGIHQSVLQFVWTPFFECFLFDESFWCEASCPPAILVVPKTLKVNMVFLVHKRRGLPIQMDGQHSLYGQLHQDKLGKKLLLLRPPETAELVVLSLLRFMLKHVCWLSFFDISNCGCSTVLTLKGETSFPKPRRKWGGSD